MAKFWLNKRGGTSQRATSASDALEHLCKIQPELSCPVCKNDHFLLMDIFEPELRTNLNYYGDQAPIPSAFTPLVSISCTRCGFLLQFNEDTLLNPDAHLTEVPTDDL